MWFQKFRISTYPYIMPRYANLGLYTKGVGIKMTQRTTFVKIKPKRDQKVR